MATTKGPGKSYRKGMTLLEVTERFNTVEKGEQWFIEQRWPNGVACPHCGGLNVATVASRKPMPFRCRECRKHFSVKTGTVLHSSNIPLNNWAIAFYLYMTNLKGVSSMKLHRDLGISQKSAWHMAHRIRETLAAQANKFAGPVEVDETYMGGKERNKHESKRLKAGRGPVGKTAVVGMKDRDTGQITSEVVESTDGPTLQEFVERNTEPTATVYTDDARAYKPIFPILGVFRLKGQSKRDSGIIFRSCKAIQSPVYPIRDAILAVNHASCPSLSSSGPRQWGESALKTSRLPGALSLLARSWLYPPSTWRRR